MIAAVIVILYFLKFFSLAPDIGESLTVNLSAVILAGIALLICTVSYFWTPKKYVFHVSLVIYLLVMATSAALISTTGGAFSPFVSLWMLICVFAGIFGLWGVLTVLITSGIFIAIQYIGGNLDITVIIRFIFSSILPLIASLIIWNGKSARDESDSSNKAYRNLADELSEVASKSEVVINAIGDGVIAIDSQGLVQLINPAAQNIIGWGKQDALALSYKSVLKLVDQKDESLDVTIDPVQQALNSNQEVRTNKFNLMTSSGNKIMISLVVSPVGEVGSGVIAVFSDITKEKAEEREQAEFISTASHEMRTPVASIEGYLGLALNPQTAQVDDRARDFIMKAHASAEHLGHLFQDLLDVAKSEDGRLSNKPKVVNIVTFIHDVTQGLKQKAADKGLRLIYKPMPEGTTEKFIAPAYSVNLDNDHIREIVNNLVENAIKYTPKGEILIDVTGDDDKVTFSVKDSGIGIPAEDIQHLFQKFYRVSDKDTNSIGGTGLGLYLCRRLAEIMGGRIWVESTYGSGSTFFVELPRISNQEASRLAEQESLQSQQFQNSTPVADAVNPEITNPMASSPTNEVETANTAEPEAQTNTVPRGQALTPEQIAAYVAKQRALVQQENTQQNRPQVVSIPARNPKQ